MNSKAQQFLWITMLLASIGVAGYAITLILTPDIAPPFLREGLSNRELRYYFHFIGGGIALISGALQFNRTIRTKWPSIHRLVGRVYLVSVLASGSAGLLMAFTSAGNWITDLGFGLLGLLWLLTGVLAYQRIRQQNIEEHQKWMIRNYALTLAAVSLRVYLPLSLGVFKFNFSDVYMIIAWACWVPNLIIAEWIFIKTLKKPKTSLGNSN